MVTPSALAMPSTVLPGTNRARQMRALVSSSSILLLPASALGLLTVRNPNLLSSWWTACRVMPSLLPTSASPRPSTRCNVAASQTRPRVLWAAGRMYRSSHCVMVAPSLRRQGLHEALGQLSDVLVIDDRL